MILRKIPKAEWPKVQDMAQFRCVVYVVVEQEWSCKIGIATHPARRLSALQCGNPRPLQLIALYEGARQRCREVEKIAHKYFGNGKNSEWVIADPEAIMKFLDSFCTEAAP